MKIRFQEETDRLLRRLELMALDLIKEHGTSRSALGPLLGLGVNTLGYNLKPDRRPKDGPPDVRYAIKVVEHFGIDPAEALWGLSSPGRPEVLLSILPGCRDVHARDDIGRGARRVSRRRKACLQAARELEDAIPRLPARLAEPWPMRRFHDPELAPAYRELEQMEERRYRNADAVEELCANALIEPLPEDPTPAEAIRRIGLLGIWGTVQRSRRRLEPARRALTESLAAARRLGDSSLLAFQIQRAALILLDLASAPVALNMMREAAEQFQLDSNTDGVAITLIGRGALFVNAGEIKRAERLYFTGLECLSHKASGIFRAIAAQGIAVCRDHSGDLEGALAYLARADSREQCEDSLYRPYLLHTAANLQRKLGCYEDALAKYSEALDLLSEQVNPEAELKICLDLAVCLIQADERHRLSEVSSRLLLIIPTLPSQGHLRQQYELLMRELASEPVDFRVLKSLRSGELDGAADRATAAPCSSAQRVDRGS